MSFWAIAAAAVLHVGLAYDAFTEFDKFWYSIGIPERVAFSRNRIDFMTTKTLTLSEIEAAAEEAYIFSFPMLMGYRFGFATFLAPPLPSYRGELNEMHGSATTLDHNFRDVITPNADTPYSMAGLDLRAEPMVLDVPAVADR